MNAPNAGTVNQLAYGVAPPGFRLPDATHIGRVRLQVSDLQRSIDYYHTVLGFHVARREGGVAELTAHGSDDVLIELRERPGVRAVPKRGRIGLYHFAILVPERAALGRFLSHLMQGGIYAGMSDHFVSEALYLSDPDGLGIEVYADRPRVSWRHHDRQLAMATEPLDVRSVVSAGAGEPWTGMPAGTVIGHVHLHVGDIAGAERFYHNALGLDKIVWSYPGALFMSAGGYHHHLGTNTWAAGAAPASEEDARLIDWELVLPEDSAIESAGRSLRDAGFDATRGDDGMQSADPWGTRVRLTRGPER
jgi:catechol 2,3-dioxygenase